MANREQLIAELQELAEELGETPSTETVRESDLKSPSTYIREFGSWNEAVRAAGLKPRKLHEIPREDIIADLERIYSKHGKITTNLLNKEGNYGVATYFNKFNTIAEMEKEMNSKPTP